MKDHPGQAQHMLFYFFQSYIECKMFRMNRCSVIIHWKSSMDGLSEPTLYGTGYERPSWRVFHKQYIKHWSYCKKLLLIYSKFDCKYVQYLLMSENIQQW